MSIVFVIFLIRFKCTRGNLVIYQVQIMKRKMSKQKWVQGSKSINFFKGELLGYTIVSLPSLCQIFWSHWHTLIIETGHMEPKLGHFSQRSNKHWASVLKYFFTGMSFGNFSKKIYFSIHRKDYHVFIIPFD